MFDFICKLILAAVVGTTVVATVCIVKGIIDERKIKQAMRDKDIGEAIIETVSKSARKVKLKDLKQGATLEIEGDGISDEIYEGMKIYA